MTAAEAIPDAVAPLRIAVAQMRMCWEGDDNTATVIAAIERAAAEGAQFALFP